MAWTNQCGSPPTLISRRRPNNDDDDNDDDDDDDGNDDDDDDDEEQEDAFVEEKCDRSVAASNGSVLNKQTCVIKIMSVMRLRSALSC